MKLMVAMAFAAKFAEAKPLGTYFDFSPLAARRPLASSQDAMKRQSSGIDRASSTIDFLPSCPVECDVLRCDVERNNVGDSNSDERRGFLRQFADSVRSGAKLLREVAPFLVLVGPLLKIGSGLAFACDLKLVSRVLERAIAAWKFAPV